MHSFDNTMGVLYQGDPAKLRSDGHWAISTNDFKVLWDVEPGDTNRHRRGVGKGSSK